MMMLRYLCWTVVACLAVGVSVVDGDVFTSVQEMEHLYHLEERLLKTLESVIRYHQSKLDILTQQHTRLMSERPPSNSSSDYLEHPVNNFVLIRRLHRNWPLILNLISESYSIPADLISGVQSIGDQEMGSAVRGLARLQHVYSLDTDLLADGSVEGVKGSAVLSAADCVEIAEWLVLQFEFHMSSTWLRTALRRVVQEGDLSVSWEKVISYLHVVNTLGKCDFPDFTPLSQTPLLQLVNNTPSLTLDTATATWFRRSLSQDCTWFNRAYKTEAAGMTPEYNLAYNELCAGPVRRPGGLHCHLVHYHNPSLRLAPFKVEEVHISPPIILVHQVISDNEINEMKEAAAKVLTDCETVRDGKPVTTTHRICKRGWVVDNASPVSERISRRIGQLANLNVNSSEPNQVGCYGLGGEYKLHSDYIEGMEIGVHPFGQREATVMLYLNDVAHGGNTVFPRLNVALAPVKGSAVMWFNILFDSQEDGRLVHGGCPVLLGSKWVLNKWIHEAGQDYVTHCPRDKKFPKDHFYL